MRGTRYSTLAAFCALVGACTVSDAGKSVDTTKAAATTPAPAAAPAAPVATTTTGVDSGAIASGVGTDSAMRNGALGGAAGTSPVRVEVDIKARKLNLYEGDKLVETHAVAVGSTKWPTQPGEWTIKQVVFNPEWTPPDESWAEEREPRKSGDPKNPLGVAQLVYDPPRTIHGTNMPKSIGTATSHGSIRMRNEEIVALAKRLLQATGAAKDEAWYQRAATERTTKQIVELPRPIPIRVF